MRELLISEYAAIVGGGDTGSAGGTASGGSTPSVSCPAGYVPVVAGGNINVTFGGINVSGNGYFATCYPM